MVVFTLLLSKVHVFANFMFNLNRETIGSERGNTPNSQNFNLSNCNAAFCFSNTAHAFIHLHLKEIQCGNAFCFCFFLKKSTEFFFSFFFGKGIL